MFFCCLLEGQKEQQGQEEQQRDFKGPKVFKGPKKDVGPQIRWACKKREEDFRGGKILLSFLLVVVPYPTR